MLPVFPWFGPFRAVRRLPLRPYWVFAYCAALLVGVAPAHAKAGRATRPGTYRTTPPQGTPLPSGCLPDEVRARLASVSAAEVSRACGHVDQPWAYRGPTGRPLALRDYGRHLAPADWAQSFASLLLRDAVVDTAWRVPGTQVSCDAAEGGPLYLVRFTGAGRPTYAVLRFDVRMVLLFDSELPLGMIEMGEKTNALWAALGTLVEDDPLLRGPVPAAAAPDSTWPSPGRYLYVEELPEVLERVPPTYPEAARRQDVSGTVFVQALVGRDGLVHDAIVVNGPPELRDASLEAVWQWRFRPAKANGLPLVVWVMLPVKFTLH
jgi:TonB family protein